VLVAQATSAAAKSGKHTLRNGDDEYVIDHATRTLSRKSGKTIPIPEKYLPKLEESFDQISALDLFFSALNQDREYKDCVEAGRKSNHRLRATSAPVSASAPRVGSFRTANLRAAPVTPGNASLVSIPVNVTGGAFPCADWAAALDSMYQDYASLRVNYFGLLAGALGSGVSVSVGADIGIILDPRVVGIAVGYAFSQLTDLWTEMLYLQQTINITEVIMAGMGCITQLPTVSIGASDGTALIDATGSDCPVYQITVYHSDDGGDTWYVVAQWIWAPPC
jgi:hypothetical protein